MNVKWTCANCGEEFGIRVFIPRGRCPRGEDVEFDDAQCPACQQDVSQEEVAAYAMEMVECQREDAHERSLDR